MKNTILIEKQYDGWYITFVRNGETLHCNKRKSKPTKAFLRKMQLKFFEAEEVQVVESA